ncbi:molecular chaperone HtpG [Ruminococcus champanellensis]|uniref:Chaperone protein HtpG n=1 Tax=Ruminococcus champanellensis (strain DSM 18848 / JCM 17042 / KCTC 15320 / 18P13) TaxID=213810 RepID=D4LF86_RUMC1|nr:molecular chaperone HtpG [Ruminococcus champanellensis]CBL18281.1 Molecular chaperone, HSP90 family [Ruminococcus champanellensis 18P13 = JCM 17042]
MKTKQFKAESKRLLDMMIHSIYTHKEIFLRELISNASDAMDKLYFRSLTDEKVGMNREDFAIDLKIDKDARTLTITDNGIGMTQEELEKNLGTIANSGSLKFKNENKLEDDVDIIGQFGVGFYSAFMVAKRVTVRSKAYGSDEAYQWQSEGVDGYTIEPCDKETVGTEIILEIKDDAEDETYSEFLEQYRIQGLVKKYSDYIRYPIRMDMTKSRRKETENADKDAAPEYEEYVENETLNSMVPLWRKNKSELTDADYNAFYKEKFFDYNEPLLHIHTKSEGTATFNALLYIPSKAPYDYYTKEYEKGLQLYSSGVMIMEKCADLLPDYFSFVKGLVDSEDLSLNISRELLQHDRQLKIIAKALEKSIRNELTKLLKNDRAAYEKFFEAFGLQLKFGVYNGYGMNKDALKDLLLFYSSSEKKPVTLAEYVSRMKEDQTCIYYATGENIARIDHLPQTELVKDKGFEILYLTENVDEFAIKMLMNYEGKEFKSVSAGDLDLETEEEKKEIEEKSKEHADLFNDMQKALEGKVKSVRLSQRLKSHPVCLTSEGALSLEMEKVLNAMPTDQKVQADRVLEINPEHPIFAKLVQLQKENPDKLKAYAKLLYDQALLIEGMSIEDPVAFSNQICELMA